MAWTAPATWSTSEVVVASKMNTHIRDNLNYLKGNAGRITIADGVTLPTTTGTSGYGLRFANGATDMANVQSLDLAGNSYIFFSTNRQFDGTAWQQLNARAAGLVQITQDAFTYSTFPAASSTPTARFTIDNTGSVGIGATSPAGKLHVAGAGAVAGAGFAISSVAAVTSIQTVLAAGAIARGCIVLYIDRNNSGGALASGLTTAILVSGSTTYTNSDTIALAVTAGGALTAQRTIGTSGSHDITIFAIFQ